MAVAVEVLTLVLEFVIDWGMAATGEQCMIDHVRDVIALRCTNRRRGGDVEIRADLFVARGLRGHFYTTRRLTQNMGRFYMSFFRAVIGSYTRTDLLLMRLPAPVELFHETLDQVVHDVILARDRLRDAELAHRIVDLDTNEDLQGGAPGSEDESDAGSDVSIVAATSSTDVPWGGWSSSSPDVADLADLEGGHDADVA
jgi:hypothetical protein